MTLFPIFMKLAGRRCLVVGAGAVGEPKITSLLAAGAVVRVVAPHATARVAAWARTGLISWERRAFHPADLRRTFLVVAATSSPAVHERIFREVRRRRVLCNVVDDPPRCDFYYPAVVRRGDLQIAVSTAGRSPALAQRLRRELDRQFGREYARWVVELGRAREALLARRMDRARRVRLLHRLASRDAFARFLRGRRERERAKEIAMSGKVYLVGSGPGDPELLTLKALRVLGAAEVVLHDDLVSDEILELVPPSARVQSVGKRHGPKTTTQAAINATLVDSARAGLTVVRLKGGDPVIFGRAGEEIEALRAAGVDVEVVPGVTAAAAAAASAAISLTDRRHASALVLLTGHRCATTPPPDWRALVRLHATIAVYMPGKHHGELAMQLQSVGLDPKTPCVIVARATMRDERIYRTTLAKLATAPHMSAPALLIIGEVSAPSRWRRPAFDSAQLVNAGREWNQLDGERELGDRTNAWIRADGA